MGYGCIGDGCIGIRRVTIRACQIEMVTHGAAALRSAPSVSADHARLCMFGKPHLAPMNIGSLTHRDDRAFPRSELDRSISTASDMIAADIVAPDVIARGIT
jgi:hypothetical protein